MTRVPRRISLYLVLAAGAFLAGCGGVTLRDLSSPRPVPLDACIVVGFLGGRDRWDDAEKGVRRLALELRAAKEALFAETFENRRRDVAIRFLVDALDADGNGSVSLDESRARRLVVYGQSFGGAAVVKLARELQVLGIEILLTIQVDSVGRGDAEIPSNVRYAVNIYQDDGWFIEGEHPIRAEDPSETVVLGNWRFRYDRPPGSEISLAGVPWWKLLFRIAHARMDRDDRVWGLVERMIRAGCAGRDLVELARELNPNRRQTPRASTPPQRRRDSASRR